ncbi:hypothetical protein PRIPAC_94154 [Pristionchus pacificus]|uniref:Cytochrome b561 domain-containing protein n=1 Tax=Pristionchus pacificus TaxID=54126 RepID=A0A2A6BAC2_PRIPA|nr:hypothetical protein PRIPAC_94154 [Pristionchus pacificus]|eukprot:PDM62835.1 hypothetical protein PRIPAC_50050 [Pristionchus pacificus]
MALLFDPNHLILNEKQSEKLFNGLLITSQVLGALSILLVAVWMGGIEDGFAWTSDPEKEFHYHPTFMVMGMVFLFGESLLVYRVFRHERKKFSKTLHLILHTLVLCLALTALKAVFDNHNLHVDPKTGEIDPLPNMMSLHSWIGMATVVIFAAQYAGGFITFFFPGLSMPTRAMVLPYHQVAGLGIFMMVSVAVALGISERAAWKHTCWTQKREWCAQHFVSNISGLCIFLYSVCIIILVANPRWKRQPLPEEQSLQQLNTYTTTNVE